MAEGEALREVVVRFVAVVEGEDELEHLNESADHTKEKLEGAHEAAEKSKGFFKGLGEALEGVAAVFAGSEILHGIRETTEGLESLAHLSEQTGIATQDIEFFSFVVSQAGGNVDEFKGQLSSMQRALSRTDSATSPQSDALKKLGIDTKDASGEARGMSEVLPEVFENFGKLKNPAEEAAVAQRLFGRSGLALLPVLREGAKGFEEYRAQFEETGGATPQESIERAKEYEKALKRMTAAFGDLKTHLVTGVLPALTKVVDGLTKGGAWLSKFLKGTTAADHAVVALAGAFAGPLFAAIKPFLGTGLKFLAIYAAVDDLLAFLEGKKSLIGDALDAMFGQGTAEVVRAWVLDAKNAFLDFQGSAQATFEAMASSSSSFTEKALASFIAFVRDASNGFPVLSASLKMELDLMIANLEEFAADALDKIKPFTKALAAAAVLTLGPAGIPIAAALNAAGDVDTAAIRGKAQTERQAAGDRAAEVEAGLRGIKSNTFGTEAGGLVARQAIADQNAAGPAARTSATLTGEQAAQVAKADEFATLGGAKALGFTATLNSNNTFNLSFPEGTDEKTVAMVKSALANAQADNNRVALEQLTQRAGKK